MKYHEYSQEKVASPEFCRAQKIAKEIYEHMCTPDISRKIHEVHKINARSHEIQNIILPKCEALGLVSERKGLFLNYALRPDYYVEINGSGLILEVERGKTIANNMDLVDIWKCHICEEADYLLLIVPIFRQTSSGGKNSIYEQVVKRIRSFFKEQNYVNVKGCFIIGYG